MCYLKISECMELAMLEEIRETSGKGIDKSPKSEKFKKMNFSKFNNFSCTNKSDNSGHFKVFTAILAFFVTEY